MWQDVCTELIIYANTVHNICNRLTNKKPIARFCNPSIKSLIQQCVFESQWGVLTNGDSWQELQKRTIQKYSQREPHSLLHYFSFKEKFFIHTNFRKVDFYPGCVHMWEVCYTVHRKLLQINNMISCWYNFI